MFVFNKTIEAKNFRAVAGLSVPPRYSSRHAIQQIREKYGEDSIKEVPRIYMHPEQIREFFTDVTDEQVKQLVERVAALEVEVETLEKDNKSLKAQLAASKRKTAESV
jgi:cell shape-determining protein MreC